jgi:hypothetical protein
MATVVAMAIAMEYSLEEGIVLSALQTLNDLRLQHI